MDPNVYAILFSCLGQADYMPQADGAWGTERGADALLTPQPARHAARSPAPVVTMEDPHKLYMGTYIWELLGNI